MSTRLYVKIQCKWKYPQGAGRHKRRRNACRAVLDKARCLAQFATVTEDLSLGTRHLQPPRRLMCLSLAVAAASTP